MASIEKLDGTHFLEAVVNATISENTECIEEDAGAHVHPMNWMICSRLNFLIYARPHRYSRIWTVRPI